MISAHGIIASAFQNGTYLLAFHPVVRTWLSLTRCQGSTLVGTCDGVIRLVATKSQSLGFGSWESLALSLPDLRRVRCLVALIGLVIFLPRFRVNSWR